MRNIISEEGTISGKTALLRYFLIFVIIILLEFLIMPNDNLSNEGSKEALNMRYFFREHRYFDLCKYLILDIIFYYFLFITIIKRLYAFYSSKSIKVKSFLSKLTNNFIGPAIVFPIFYSEFRILPEEKYIIFGFYFLFWFFIVAIIPSLINSPVTDYKDHKG